MPDKMIIALIVVIVVLVADVVYIVSMSSHVLNVFERKRKIPTWYRLMDDVARVFSKTPLLAAEERVQRDRELSIEASAHEVNPKRTYLGLKISIPDTVGHKAYSSLSTHIGKNDKIINKEEAEKERKRREEEEKFKPKDIETCQEYHNILETVLSEIEKYIKGVKFKRIYIEQITDGDMKQYDQLNMIRAKLVTISGMILKADVNPEVKKYYSNIHYNFQLYINQLVIGLDKLMDFIYQGDKRMLAEGQNNIKAANKYLGVIYQKMKDNRV